MERRIHGENANYPSIAASLHELGTVLELQRESEGVEA